MKKVYVSLCILFTALTAMADGVQGWPANYGGVMLQGFSWDSYSESQWTKLESQMQDFKGYIDLIWVPQSGRCLESGNVMGYTPYYYFDQNSSFGTESELRSMIKTFKNNGIGTIADVVVNHHNTDGWFSFPAETYNGVTYQLQSTDIVANDDNGATATQAATDGVSLSQNDDEGEDWSGCRDLDHKSENVQRVIKAYVKYLKDDLGYTGFRYDMVKGFGASHVADYNDAAGVDFSVGEYWDSNESIENWINNTGKKSAAFDFQFRYNIRDAINGSDWRKLNSTYNLMHDADYRRYAVTFVENHDMQDRGTTNGYTPDAITKDIPAANAYMLAMPGTPCIFQPHWLDYKQELKAMIDARKLAGINNQSTYTNKFSTAACYANEVAGTNAKLIAVVGAPTRYTCPTGYTRIISKTRYAYYLANTANTVWLDIPSGEYSDGSVTVTPTIVCSAANAKIVYTTDGSAPTVSSQQIADSTAISITENCTLRAALLIDGKVTGEVSRQYTISQFEPYTITVYVNTDKVGWNSVCYHYWGSASNKETSWPGVQVTATKEVNGKTWFCKDFSIKSKDESVNFVFNTDKGNTQTVDVDNVNRTSYFEISTSKTGTKYQVNDVTDTMTGISMLSADKAASDSHWYTLSGMRLSGEPTQHGVFIHQGKKVMK